MVPTSLLSKSLGFVLVAVQPIGSLSTTPTHLPFNPEVPLSVQLARTRDQPLPSPPVPREAPAIAPETMAWAAHNLKTLIKKYACLPGNAPSTFATTYEIAAALISCAAAIQHRVVDPKDRALLRVLEVEFAFEIERIKYAVENIE